jgi:fatty acid desaturase
MEALHERGNDQPVVDRDQSLYGELLGAVREAGLLNQDRRYYQFRIGVVAVLVTGGWVAVGVIGDSWLQICVAPVIGIISAHASFVVHEAGHHQMFRKRLPNDLVGLMSANLANGMSYGWWVDKHRRHHKNPNHVDLDPDIASRSISFFPAAARRRTGFSGWICRHQAVVVALALPAQAVLMHVKSIGFLLKTGSRYRLLEIGLIAVHLTFYGVALLALMPVGKALAFAAVHQGVLGIYLALSFAPNHKGMPVITDQQADFLTRQVATARNIRGGRILDTLFGGVNLQIEHHLFPSMSTPALRKAQPIVRRFCEAHAIPYLETSFAASYRQAFGYLHRVGRGRQS